MSLRQRLERLEMAAQKAQPMVVRLMTPADSFFRCGEAVFATEGNQPVLYLDAVDLDA